MEQMAKAYENLLPYLYSEKRFSDPSFETAIELRIKQLSQGANGLDRHLAKPLIGEDPLFKIGLNGLKNQILKANESFFVGEKEYSRHLLQYSLNYCNSCHLISKVGPRFIKPDQFAPIIKDLNFIERAKIYIATRSFEKASQELLNGINSTDSSQELKQKALEQFFLLANLNSFNSSLIYKELIKVDQEKLSPKHKKEINAWLSQLKKGKFDNLSVDKIISVVKKKNKNSDLLESVIWSGVLHKSLKQNLDSKKRAQVLLSLGRIYEGHDSLSMMGLPENYFKSCIETYPHSKTASTCYYALEYFIVKSKRKGHPLGYLDEDLKRLKIKASEQTSSPGAAGAFPEREF